jgi:signal transduction histidine kinase
MAEGPTSRQVSSFGVLAPDGAVEYECAQFAADPHRADILALAGLGSAADELHLVAATERRFVRRVPLSGGRQGLAVDASPPAEVGAPPDTCNAWFRVADGAPELVACDTGLLRWVAEGLSIEAHLAEWEPARPAQGAVRPIYEMGALRGLHLCLPDPKGLDARALAVLARAADDLLAASTEAVQARIEAAARLFGEALSATRVSMWERPLDRGPWRAVSDEGSAEPPAECGEPRVTPRCVSASARSAPGPRVWLRLEWDEAAPAPPERLSALVELAATLLAGALDRWDYERRSHHLEGWYGPLVALTQEALLCLEHRPPVRLDEPPDRVAARLSLGRVAGCNRSFAQAAGCQPLGLLHQPLSAAPAALTQALRPVLAELANAGAVRGHPLVLGARRFAASARTHPPGQAAQTTWLTLRDVTAEHQAGLALEALNAELEARVENRAADLQDATIELDAFLFMVSDELRTPIQRVESVAQLLTQVPELDDATHGELEAITNVSGEMGQVLRVLLTLYRAERAPPRRRLRELAESVRQAWATRGWAALGLGLVTESLGEVEMDPELALEGFAALFELAHRGGATELAFLREADGVISVHAKGAAQPGPAAHWSGRTLLFELLLRIMLALQWRVVERDDAVFAFHPRSGP